MGKASRKKVDWLIEAEANKKDPETAREGGDGKIEFIAQDDLNELRWKIE